MKDWKKLAVLLGVFLVAYFVPFDHPKATNAIMEGFQLLEWYAVNHTLTCVVPAIFIVGGIAACLLSSAGQARSHRHTQNAALAPGHVGRESPYT